MNNSNEGCKSNIRRGRDMPPLGPHAPLIGRSFIPRSLVLGIFVLFCRATNAQSISTVAGGGTSDGRPAVVAGLAFPQGIALDSVGNLYIVDFTDRRIRKVAAGSGIITTAAGNGASSFSGDDGPATAAGLSFPGGVAVDSAGNLYIADAGRIRKVSAGSGIIRKVAGGGGSQSDGVAA